MVDFRKRLIRTSGKKKTNCHYRNWPILVILLLMPRPVTRSPNTKLEWFWSGAFHIKTEGGANQEQLAHT